MSLSLSTTSRFTPGVTPALLRASKAMPAVMAPSPITAMCWRSIPRLRDATAIPSTAEIDVDECAVPKASYRSEEHTSELQSLMRISYAVFCLKKQTTHTHKPPTTTATYYIYS